MAVIIKREPTPKLAFVLVLLASFLISSSGDSQTFSGLAPDPSGGGAGVGGFSRNHWITQGPHKNKMLAPFGPGPVSNDNSIRVYDPVSNTWTYLLRQNTTNGTPHTRDNQASFYVPAMNEYWVWGGSHMEALPAIRLQARINTNGVVVTDVNIPSGQWGNSSAVTVTPTSLQSAAQPYINSFPWSASGNKAVTSGRLSLATTTPSWIATAEMNHVRQSSNNCAFAGVVKTNSMVSFSLPHGCLPMTGTDPATAWSETLDTGFICCGDAEGNASNLMFLIEPNTTGGPERYMVTEFTGNKPPPRQQAMNLAVAVGGDFYLLGGAGDGNQFVRDLWRLRKTNGVWSWTRLAPPATMGYTPVLTYDSDLNALVTWIDSKLYLYRIANDTWSDVTPAGLPCIFNQMGVYSQTAKVHIYEGGNRCNDGSGNYAVIGIRLSGIAPTPLPPTPTPPPPPPDTQVPSVPIGFSASAVSSSQIDLSWNASTDNVGVVGYEIYRNGTQITTVTGTSYQDTGLSAGITSSYTIAAYDAAGNTSPQSSAASATTQSSTPPPPPSSGGVLNISPKTWYGIAYTTLPSSFPGNIGTPGGKHMNLATNTSNGKIYFVGGDSNYDQGTGDNRGVWSWDPLTGVAEEEYPRCGFFGDIMPGGPNESGFAYDSKRNLFWLLPGFWFLNQSGPAGCGSSVTWNTANPINITGKVYYAINENTGDRWFEPTVNSQSNFNITYSNKGTASEQQTITKNNTLGIAGGAMPSSVRLYYQPPTAAYQVTGILTYSPVTKKWSNPGAVGESSVTGGNEKPKYAIYDAATDSIWRVGTAGGGFTWTRYLIAANKWEKYETPCAVDSRPSQANGSFCGEGPQAYINDVDPRFEWLAFDPVNRKLYTIDPNNYRLLQFDMTTHVVTIKAKPPLPPYGPFSAGNQFACQGNPNGLTDFTQPQFDTASGKLLFAWLCHLSDSRPRLFIYDPATNTWETDAMLTQPQGLVVRGNHSVYNSYHNHLMVYGGLCSGREAAQGLADPCESQNGTPFENAGDADRFLKYFFLYRYGGSAGTTTPVAKPPLAPGPLQLK